MSTFVTAYLKVYEEEYEISKNFENRLKHFISILDLGINICIFIEPELEYKFIDLQRKYSNLKIIEKMKVEDLEIYKLGNPYSEFQNLPNNKNIKKDTKKYMALMLGKLEFVKKSIDINPFNSNYFYWFDFSIAYIFKNKDKTLLKIKEISNLNFNKSFICIPGCWDFKIKINDLKNNVNWRFCGGLLFGDKESLIDFYQKSNDHFLSFLEQNKMLLWEVNYWAWLESFNLISPIWYLAGHDDSMFMNIPTFLMCKN